VSSLLPPGTTASSAKGLSFSSSHYRPRIVFLLDSSATDFEPDLRFKFSLSVDRIVAAIMANHYSRSASIACICCLSFL
jgi:hypothetical protein